MAVTSCPLLVVLLPGLCSGNEAASNKPLRSRLSQCFTAEKAEQHGMKNNCDFRKHTLQYSRALLLNSAFHLCTWKGCPEYTMSRIHIKHQTSSRAPTSWVVFVPASIICTNKFQASGGNFQPSP